MGLKCFDYSRGYRWLINELIDASWKWSNVQDENEDQRQMECFHHSLPMDIENRGNQNETESRQKKAFAKGKGFTVNRQHVEQRLPTRKPLTASFRIGYITAVKMTSSYRHFYLALLSSIEKLTTPPTLLPANTSQHSKSKSAERETHTPNSPLTFHKSSTKLKNADLPPAVFLILSIAAACSLGPGIAAPFGNPAFGHPVSRL